ncbi:MAG: fibronectin type III domain-containing protein, partial [Thermoplasmata archaeon]|nr:fibronectin type III domain-containing protein [Thermoplasmata archaeon]
SIASAALDPAHRELFVGGGRTPYNITVLPLSGAGAPTSFLTGGQAPSGLGVQPRYSELFLANVSSPVTTLFDTSTHAQLGTVRAAVSFGSISNPVDGATVLDQVVQGADLLLRPVTAPLAPSGLALLAGNTTLNASWSRIGASGSGNGTVTGYTASLGTSASGPWTTNLSVTALNATFTHLADGTVYFVTVSATNPAGAGPRAAPVSATPVGVPFPPTTPSSTTGGSGSIHLSWNPPASTDGAPVTNYTVEYSAHSSGPWSTLSAGTALNASVTGLSAATNYTLYVLAWNSVGRSNPSAQVHTATSAASSSSSSSPISGSNLLWILLALVVIAAVVAALLLARRRKPRGAPTPQPSAPYPPQYPPQGGYGAPPPGAAPPTVAPPPAGPPPGAM